MGSARRLGVKKKHPGKNNTKNLGHGQESKLSMEQTSAPWRMGEQKEKDMVSGNIDRKEKDRSKGKGKEQGEHLSDYSEVNTKKIGQPTFQPPTRWSGRVNMLKALSRRQERNLLINFGRRVDWN